MKNRLHRLLSAAFLGLSVLVELPLLSPRLLSAEVLPQDSPLSLRNEKAQISFDRQGGALIEFSLRELPLNPFTWRVARADMPENNREGAPFQGHFLCLGRWGGPSDGEKAARVPHNGEASNLKWKTESSSTADSLEMSVLAPLEQWQLHRKVRLVSGHALCVVEETLKNLQNSGRFTALVQHATLGLPFLDERLLIDCNAAQGFNQALIKESLGSHEYHWPNGIKDSQGKHLDLRKSDPSHGYVSSHVIEGDLGWATATNPAQGLLLGYVWKRAEYPWLHLWNGVKDGKLWAKGIEFGTTGLGDTYTPEKRMTTQFHGRNNLQFVDARASLSKSYVCFLLRVPAAFLATRSIRHSNHELIVEYQTSSGLKCALFPVDF